MSTRTPEERAAKRAQEQHDVKCMGVIADRFIKWRKENALECESGLRENLIIMMIQIDSGNPGLKVDWNKLMDVPDQDFFHDINGFIRHYTPPSGLLRRNFRPLAIKD